MQRDRRVALCNALGAAVRGRGGKGITVSQAVDGRWQPRIASRPLDDLTFRTPLEAKDHGVDLWEGVTRRALQSAKPTGEAS